MGGSQSTYNQTLVIIGGGYGGVELAKQLDPTFNVILIDKKDHFLHNVGGLRGCVAPGWSDLLLVPYDKLLKRGQIKQGEVVSIDSKEKKVLLASGEEIDFDYVVIATGANPNLLGRAGSLTSSSDIKQSYLDIQKQIEKAEKILVVGGGPVGVEMAGEIVSTYPQKKKVVLVHSKVGRWNTPAFQANVLKLLQQKGVEVILNDKVTFDRIKLLIPGAQTVKTDARKSIQTDLILNASGILPTKASQSKLLTSLGPTAVDEQGYIKVNEHLQLSTYHNIFAIGDCISPPWAESKTAVACKMGHIPLLTSNLLTLAKHSTTSTTAPVLKAGKPAIELMIVPVAPVLKAGKPAIKLMIVPVGPRSGAGFANGWQLPTFFAVSMKSKDVMIANTWKDMGYPSLPQPLPTLPSSKDR